MNILLTGGAGYIGSHTIIELDKAGHSVVVVDNFVNSQPEALKRVEDARGTGQWHGETIMKAPAAGFYSTPGMGMNQVRLAYVLNKKDIQRALFLLEKALEQFKSVEK